MGVKLCVETLVVGPLETNCYIVWRDGGREAMIIDPGADAERIIAALRAASPAARQAGLTPRWLVNTHGHADHIGANAALQRAFPQLRLAVHSLDKPLLDSPARNLSLWSGAPLKSPPPHRELRDGDTIEFDGLRFDVLHTPGHTPGGICLYRPAQGDEPPVLFSGDTLFEGSVGRTDLPGGSQRKLLRAIAEKLLSLPDDCLVYPGHGAATTIGRERVANPFLADLPAERGH